MLFLNLLKSTRFQHNCQPYVIIPDYVFFCFINLISLLQVNHDSIALKKRVIVIQAFMDHSI